MTTIRAYTTIEQSRKLAEILPIESADMYYRDWKRMTKYIRIAHFGSAGDGDLPCWSLAALLDFLPKGHSLGRRTNGKYYVCMTHIKHNISEFDNPVDACVAMVKKLNELKLL